MLAEIAQALGLDVAEVLRHAKRDMAERTLMQDAYLLKLPFREEDHIGPVSSLYADVGQACQRIGEQMYVAFRYHDMIQAFKSAEQIFTHLGRTDVLLLIYYRLGQSYVTLGLEATAKGVDNSVSVDYFFEAIRYFEQVYQEYIANYRRPREAEASMVVMSVSEANIDRAANTNEADTTLLLIGKSLAQSSLAHLNIWKASKKSDDQLYFREAVRLAHRSDELYKRVIGNLEARQDKTDTEIRLLADAFHKCAFLTQVIEEETKARAEWHFTETKAYFLKAIGMQQAITAMSDTDLKHLARMHKDLGIALAAITAEEAYTQALWQYTLAMQLHRDFDPARNPDARKRLLLLDQSRDPEFCRKEKIKISQLLNFCDFNALNYPEIFREPEAE